MEYKNCRLVPVGDTEIIGVTVEYESPAGGNWSGTIRHAPSTIAHNTSYTLHMRDYDACQIRTGDKMEVDKSIQFDGIGEPPKLPKKAK